MKRCKAFFMDICANIKECDFLKPWEQFFLNLANLFTVKAIISLVVVAIFIYKIFSGTEIRAEFYGVFMSVVVYWLCERSKGKDGE